MTQRIYIVAFEFAPFPGGQGTYALEMARAFVRMGKKVTVMAPQYDNAVDGSEPFEIIRAFGHQKLNLKALLTTMWLLRGIQHDDVLLAADIRAGLIATALKCVRRFKKVVMFHGGEIKKSGASKPMHVLNVVASLFAGKLVGNSSYTVDLVKKYVGGQPVVTLLGTAAYWLEKDTNEFENTELRALAASGRKLLCTVARIDPRKGHLMALDAVERLVARGKDDFTYVICGKVIEEDYAKQVFERIGKLPNNVLYVGSLSNADVRRLYAHSRIMLLTAKEYRKSVEGFGLVITEAGGQECPSIATSVGGIVDAIINGQTGYLTDPTDVVELEGKIEKLLTDDALHDAMGKAAKRFTQTLTWDATAAKTLAGL